jgi:hypothetical protein
VDQVRLRILTGPLAWTIDARVERSYQLARWPDCLDINDWRKSRAMREGTVVERTTY